MERSFGSGPINVSADNLNIDTSSLEALIGEVQVSPTANTMQDRLKALSTLIGQVQENPTANTLLDRLKAIKTSIDAMVVDVDTTDLETLIGEVQENPTQYTLLERVKTLLTGIVLNTGTNIIGRVGIDQTTDGTTNKVAVGSIAAGTNKIGSVQVRNNADDANIDPLAEATFTGRIGEVQAEPTANTVLDRLKTIATNLGSVVLSTGSAVIGLVKLSGNDAVLQGNITLSGSAQQLNADTACKNVTIQSHPDNSDYVYVGKSDVSSSIHMAVLSPGSSFTFTVSNLNLLYVLGTSSEKVSYGGEV